MGSKIMVKRLFALFVALLMLLALAVYINHAYIQETGRAGENEVNSVLKANPKQVFEPVLPNHPVVLPRDFAFHPEYQHEWWHYFANLEDRKGNHYGVQWSYFRIASDEREGKGWQSPQLYIAHIVVTSENQVWREQRVARGGIGQAGTRGQPFRLWIDDWNWRSFSNTPFPGKLTVKAKGMELQLTNNITGPLVLNGEQGYQPKHDLLPVASYNFSAPFQLTTGVLTLDGKSVEVRGKAWLSKEWGSGLLAEGQQGWDWFVFHLEDGSSLSVNHYRHNNQPAYTYGTLVHPSGQVYNLKDEDVDVIPLQASMLSNTRRLPLQWVVNVPAHGINLTTRVVRREQWLPFLIPYWEGPMEATGTQKAIGFMQLSGY
ncbi:lipocalin-like domain-containing protein [Vibrio maerlii]|uniref:lipocalin-like domain-containing protein n=1 Tax=Vibrio maerlii TaxID=2231648 RepID=UPI001F1482A1|nr:lipocalin-like domain-containing protein [Vibrio maerlii]